MRFHSVVGNEISITIDAQQVAAMKSEKPSLRLAASAAPDSIGGLDDNARFANVVMPHIDDAYRLAHWLTGNSTDARRRGAGCVVTRLPCYPALRRRQCRAWLLSIAVELAQANPGHPKVETLEATPLAKIDAEHLRAAIAALPAPFRETLVLRDIEGLDYREIAQATEVPIGTVMSRLARARLRLTVTLGGNR
jgi:RNA polymerase sigma factor (sigma-70 family)